MVKSNYNLTRTAITTASFNSSIFGIRVYELFTNSRWSTSTGIKSTINLKKSFLTISLTSVESVLIHWFFFFFLFLKDNHKIEDGISLIFPVKVWKIKPMNRMTIHKSTFNLIISENDKASCWFVLVTEVAASSDDSRKCFEFAKEPGFDSIN